MAMYIQEYKGKNGNPLASEGLARDLLTKEIELISLHYSASAVACVREDGRIGYQVMTGILACMNDQPDFDAIQNVKAAEFVGDLEDPDIMHRVEKLVEFLAEREDGQIIDIAYSTCPVPMKTSKGIETLNVSAALIIYACSEEYSA